MNPEDMAAAELNAGIAHLRAGRAADAVASFRRAIQIAPQLADAHTALAGLLARAGQLDDAIAAFRRVVELRPGSADSHYNLGVALAQAGRLDEAAAQYAQAVQLRPDWADAHNNLAATLARQHKPADAIAAYRRAVALRPDFAAAWYNLGIALKNVDLDEAIACYQRAAELQPANIDAHNNLAVALAEANRSQEAAASYRRAIALQPDHVDAHLGLAISLFRLGDWNEAWRQYEWRLRHPSLNQPALPGEPWTGRPIAGRTILARAEQGLGDTLQFVRYLPKLKEQGAKVVLQCQRSLHPLFTNFAGIDELVAADQPLPAYDEHASLLSLPGIFGTTLANVPAEVPYLQADAAAVARWRSKLSAGAGVKVGIAWQGSLANPRDAVRSIPLAAFAPLAALPGVRLYSLQHGAGSEQIESLTERFPLADFGNAIESFAEMAALMAALDLIVTCDSAPAHLAGALGLPVWVALPHSPDWRWLLDRADSPWYPTMRLFRQPRRGDWPAVFHQVTRELGSGR